MRSAHDMNSIFTEQEHAMLEQAIASLNTDLIRLETNRQLLIQKPSNRDTERDISLLNEEIKLKKLKHSALVDIQRKRTIPELAQYLNDINPNNRVMKATVYSTTASIINKLRVKCNEALLCMDTEVKGSPVKSNNPAPPLQPQGTPPGFWMARHRTLIDEYYSALSDEIVRPGISTQEQDGKQAKLDALDRLRRITRYSGSQGLYAFIKAQEQREGQSLHLSRRFLGLLQQLKIEAFHDDVPFDFLSCLEHRPAQECRVTDAAGKFTEYLTPPEKAKIIALRDIEMAEINKLDHSLMLMALDTLTVDKDKQLMKSAQEQRARKCQKVLFLTHLLNHPRLDNETLKAIVMRESTSLNAEFPTALLGTRVPALLESLTTRERGFYFGARTLADICQVRDKLTKSVDSLRKELEKGVFFKDRQKEKIRIKDVKIAALNRLLQDVTDHKQHKLFVERLSPEVTQGATSGVNGVKALLARLEVSHLNNQAKKMEDFVGPKPVVHVPPPDARQLFSATQIWDSLPVANVVTVSDAHAAARFEELSKTPLLTTIKTPATLLADKTLSGSNNNNASAAALATTPSLAIEDANKPQASASGKPAPLTVAEPPVQAQKLEEAGSTATASATPVPPPPPPVESAKQSVQSADLSDDPTIPTFTQELGDEAKQPVSKAKQATTVVTPAATTAQASGNLVFVMPPVVEGHKLKPTGLRQEQEGQPNGKASQASVVDSKPTQTATTPATTPGTLFRASGKNGAAKAPVEPVMTVAPAAKEIGDKIFAPAPGQGSQGKE
jgi:hypothetical protein